MAHHKKLSSIVNSLSYGLATYITTFGGAVRYSQVQHVQLSAIDCGVKGYLQNMYQHKAHFAQNISNFGSPSSTLTHGLVQSEKCCGTQKFLNQQFQLEMF